MKISIWKKIKLYFVYTGIIKRGNYLLQNEANLRVDRVTRLYTVLNIDEEDIKNYGPKLSNQIVQKYINEYINKVDRLFNTMGLTELVGLMEIRKINELNYLIVFGYSIFNTSKVANMLILILTLTIFAALYLVFLY